MIIFDATSKRIVLDSASVTATELYSRWCDWAASGDNIKHGLVIRQVGSDDLGSGLSIPPYYFLQGSWRVRPMESNHNLTITGNLFVEGGGVPVVQTLGTYQVNVNYTVPVQAQGISTSGGSAGPTVAEIVAGIMAQAQITPIHANAVIGGGSGSGSYDLTFVTGGGSGSTPTEIADAVLAAAELTPIKADAGVVTVDVPSSEEIAATVKLVMSTDITNLSNAIDSRMAQSTIVPANIVAIKGKYIDGGGTTDNPWRPV